MWGMFPDDDYYDPPANNDQNPKYMDGQRLALLQEDGSLLEMTSYITSSCLIAGRIPVETPYTGKKIVIL